MESNKVLHAYDQYPSLLKQTLCSLNRITLVDTSVSAAQIVQSRDTNGDVNGLELLLNRELLSQPLRLSDWLTWKEQLSFGGGANALTPSAEMPTIAARVLHMSNSFVGFLIAHELGHVLDLERKVSSEWLPLSWNDHSSPTTEFDFPLRSNMCFYWCQGTFLSPTQASSYYDALLSKPFVTSYAATDPGEDFAETFAVEVFKRVYGFTLSVTVPGTRPYDLDAHFASPLLNAKREFVAGKLEAWGALD